jgi:hypothetical protein
MKRKRKDDALRKPPEGASPRRSSQKKCCPLPTTGLAGKDKSEVLIRSATTRPSIIALPRGWQAAFQANTGNLWLAGADNNGDTGLGMMR